MKKTIIVRTNEILYFKRLKKTNEMGRSRTMDERNEKAELAQLASRHKHFKLQRTCFKLKLKR